MEREHYYYDTDLEPLPLVAGGQGRSGLSVARDGIAGGLIIVLLLVALFLPWWWIALPAALLVGAMMLGAAILGPA